MIFIDYIHSINNICKIPYDYEGNLSYIKIISNYLKLDKMLCQLFVVLPLLCLLLKFKGKRTLYNYLKVSSFLIIMSLLTSPVLWVGSLSNFRTLFLGG